MTDNVDRALEYCLENGTIKACNLPITLSVAQKLKKKMCGKYFHKKQISAKMQIRTYNTKRWYIA